MIGTVGVANDEKPNFRGSDMPRCPWSSLDQIYHFNWFQLTLRAFATAILTDDHRPGHNSYIDTDWILTKVSNYQFPGTFTPV